MPTRSTSDQQLRAFVDYKQPSFEELKCRFTGPKGVDAKYEICHFGSDYEHVRRVSRELNFFAVYLEYPPRPLMGPPFQGPFKDDHIGIHNTEVQLAMRQRGFRPAIYEELLAFAKKYPSPSESGIFDVTALGSTTTTGHGHHWVPMLICDPRGYSLSMRRENHWCNDQQFLAVACDS